MPHLTFRNVNDAFVSLVTTFRNGQRGDQQEIEIVKTNTRNGPVLQIPGPMILTFTNPTERLLFNNNRDANCFFHLFESLYMLSGGNKIVPLVYYAAQIANYSDDGETQNGAYGYRWRNAKTSHDLDEFDGHSFQLTKIDQLQVLIQHLKNEPNSRRAVLQMWNVEDDLLKIDPPNKSKDVCCNLCVMFSLRDVSIVDVFDTRTEPEHTTATNRVLDMTVINRSNDLVWGMLGANYVHFSFLQEYMAANLGVEVGVYNQMSNNLHIYTENNSGFKHEEWLADKTPDWYLERFMCNPPISTCKQVPLIRYPAIFERELSIFIEASIKHEFLCNYTEPFLQSVATPLLWAFELHKKREYDLALNAIKACQADDWRIAGDNWLKKRKANYEAKELERNNAL